VVSTGLKMFKIKDHYILQGSKIEVTWDLDSKSKLLYLWYPNSWLPWKNYTPITTSGKMLLFVSGKQINIKIKQFHFFGFKTLHSIKRKVNSIEIKNIENNVQLLKNATINNLRKSNFKIVRLFINKKISGIQTKTPTINPKVKSPSINNILPIN
jgi:hypothetical protein